MRIRETIYKNMNELPGYDLLGYSEVAIPIYETKLHALALMKNTIPVVEEFVLNFYAEGLELEEIQNVLGLDKELINQAWAGLQQRDYISYIDKHITDRGEEYLSSHSVEELEKIEIPIMIDCITGKITTVNNQLMNTSNIKKIGIRSLKANMYEPNIDSIDFKSVKSVFNKYKKENPNFYLGEILEILRVEGKSTKFKRIEILIFKNGEGDIRVLAYDGYSRLDNYEEKLKELDKKGIKLLKYENGGYFNSVNVEKINKLIKSDEKNCEMIPLQFYNKKLDEYMCNNNDVIIVTPLVSMCNFNTGFINKIETNLSKGKRIRVIISGSTYISEYQKKIYNILSSLKDKHRNLIINQIPEYINKIVIDEKNRCALITMYQEKELSLKASNYGIVERAFMLKNELFNEVKNIVFSLYNVEELLKFDLSNFNKSWLKEKIVYIIKLVRDADGYMSIQDSVGWIGNQEIPDVMQLEQIPLAINNVKFGVFIESINKSLIESIDINAKSRKYFWNDFKNKYPNLQHILDKIRTYRNKSKHLKLTNENEKKYLEYLKEDLNGYMPDFISNGFLILQCKIINELEDTIKNVIIELKK